MRFQIHNLCRKRKGKGFIYFEIFFFILTSNNYKHEVFQFFVLNKFKKLKSNKGYAIKYNKRLAKF